MLRWGTAGENHFLFDGESDRYLASITYSIMGGYIVRVRGKAIGSASSVEQGKILINAELRKESEALLQYLGGVSATA